ncbi:MAG: hypothetical protein HZB53_10715 [Chloroflexi bacterium]|nr:hypothetical protein [Chloroflexota bacterium]
MSGKVIAGVLLVLFLLAAVAFGVGLPAYQFGVAQGLADSGKIVAPPAGVPYMYGPGMHFGRFGWGFGPLNCLFPLLGFFIVLGVLRMLFWRGPRMWRHGRWGEGGVPPMFEDWHRRAHGETPAEPQTKTNL